MFNWIYCSSFREFHVWLVFKLIFKNSITIPFRVFQRWRRDRLCLTSNLKFVSSRTTWEPSGLHFKILWKYNFLRKVEGIKYVFFMEHPVFGQRFGKHSKNERKFVWSIMCSKCASSEIYQFFVNLSIWEKTSI